MITTMLTKIDKKLKEQAQKTAAELGLPLSTVINNYLKSFVMEKQVTFSAPMPNAKTRRDIQEAQKDYKEGKNISPSFSSAKDAIAYLRKHT
jgi:addiction module RelB/DinJ family antitoxin